MVIWKRLQLLHLPPFLKADSCQLLNTWQTSQLNFGSVLSSWRTELSQCWLVLAMLFTVASVQGKAAPNRFFLCIRSVASQPEFLPYCRQPVINVVWKLYSKIVLSEQIWISWNVYSMEVYKEKTNVRPEFVWSFCMCELYIFCRLSSRR